MLALTLILGTSIVLPVTLPFACGSSGGRSTRVSVFSRSCAAYVTCVSHQNGAVPVERRASRKRAGGARGRRERAARAARADGASGRRKRAAREGGAK